MSGSFSIARVLPATPEQIYKAWLDGDQHSEMTGAGATSNPTVGRTFTARDGYIEGINVELAAYRRIVQRWRTVEFPVDEPNSLLKITLERSNGGTLLTINHSEIPNGQGDSCKTGWVDHYFDPIVDYFRSIY